MLARRIAVAVLLGALVLGAVPASAAICDDASRCAIPTAAASCRSFAALFTSPAGSIAASEAHVLTPPGNNSQNTHLVDLTHNNTFPAVRVHVGGVESFCQAYTDGGLRRACGRSVIEDLVLNLNPVARVVIQARGIVSEGCTSNGSEIGAYNESHIARIIISVGNGTGPLDLGPVDQNTAIGLGPGLRLILNESTQTVAGCIGSTGSTLHLETPSGDVVVGWVSTGACS